MKTFPATNPIKNKEGTLVKAELVIMGMVRSDSSGSMGEPVRETVGELVGELVGD